MARNQSNSMNPAVYKMLYTKKIFNPLQHPIRLLYLNDI